MKKTKCQCGARYEYELTEAGTSIACECGRTVNFPAIPQEIGKCSCCGKGFYDASEKLTWFNKDVCAKCYKKQDAAYKKQLAKQEAAVSVPLLAVDSGERMMCQNPNCKFVGSPQKKGRGSAVVMVFLFLFGVLPGLIYAILMSGYDYFCPQCGMKLRTEHR